MILQSRGSGDDCSNATEKALEKQKKTGTDHSAAKTRIRLSSVSHKTKGGALSCLQPIFAHESCKKGGDVTVSGQSYHALVFLVHIL